MIAHDSHDMTQNFKPILDLQLEEKKKHKKWMTY